VGGASGGAALKRAWSDGVPSAEEPLPEQPGAKRARAAAAADDAPAGAPDQAPPAQLRPPQLPPSLLQGMGLSFPAEPQVPPSQSTVSRVCSPPPARKLGRHWQHLALPC
jgi:hypothetical protein